jgi:hypothetical protein
MTFGQETTRSRRDIETGREPRRTAPLLPPCRPYVKLVVHDSSPRAVVWSPLRRLHQQQQLHQQQHLLHHNVVKPRVESRAEPLLLLKQPRQTNSPSTRWHFHRQSGVCEHAVSLTARRSSSRVSEPESEA